MTHYSKANTNKIDHKSDKGSSYSKTNSLKCQGFVNIVVDCPNWGVVSFIDDAPNEEYDKREDTKTTSDDRATFAAMVRC